ncbi:MAG: helix-turn-helix transcriptional regulator [Solirubrobacterales bacterium]|nr:helix-turn-helix transcriptional regulator [Solirubrobacterales bacterium]
MHSNDTSPDELAARVGRLIRGHRLAQELSVADLAERSELSRTILARIERGEGNPSIATLWAVARALALPLGDLLVDAPAPRTRLIRATEGDAIPDPSGIVGRLLHTDGRARRSELFAIELPPAAERLGPPHLPGVEEVVVITAGSAEVGPAGALERLGPGDALWFAADVEHVYRTRGRGTCHLLDFILYPPVEP